MWGNKKNVFWEAFVITCAVFILGLLIGLFVESSQLQSVNNYYAKAEVSLIDSLALTNSINSGESCSVMINTSISFADKIYNEAALLEDYENSGKITDSMKIAHAKYDLLRTILWQNLMTIQKKCPGQFNYLIYLYEYNPPNLNQKATENVWSNILYGLKQEEGNNLILVPIAVNSNLSSLNAILDQLNITNFPAIVINGNQTFYSLQSANDLQKYLS